MDQVVFILSGRPVTLAECLIAAGVLLAALFLWRMIAASRARGEWRREAQASAARADSLAAQLAEIARANQDLGGRVDGMAGQLNARQTDSARLVAERLDHVAAKVGLDLKANAESASAGLSQLRERLAVIDAAQARMAGMTQEVVSLKEILANKQTRGAFGQGRMEAIIRDGLPGEAFDFQFTLKGGARPDCVIHLPSDERPLAIDAKFPLEAFTLFKDARSDEARKFAVQRVRTDVGKHVKDIADRYLVTGETQDLALMFVPSESLYADLVEHFDDIVQKAHRAKVMIVSPSLLTIAIQIVQTLTHDSRMRRQAHLIQDEMGRLSEDIGRLVERAGNLEKHFAQMQDDVSGVLTSAAKVLRRAQKIERMEFDEQPVREAPVLRLAKGGE